MSIKDKNPFDDFNLLKLQKQYMDALLAFNASAQTGAGRDSSFTASPWVDAMDSWWKAIKPGLGNADDELYEKIIQQCRNYYFISEQFGKMVEGMSANRDDSDDFVAFINGKFREMETLFTGNQNLFNWSSIVDSMEQPVDTLKAIMENTSMFSNDIMHDYSPEMRKLREQYLTMPGLGYSRETQEKIQEAIRLWAVYQDNNQEFQTPMAGLSHQALDLMRKKLLAMHESGEEVNSMRQVYDIWVEANETVYGEYVFTEEYAELNGRLVNSLMAFKKQSHEITEELLSAMNLPTNKSIKALERRQHELRKQIRELEHQVKDMREQPAVQKPVKQSKTSARKAKPVRKKRKKATKASPSKNTNIIEFSKSANKPGKRSDKQRKNKKKTKSRSPEKGMIEIKF